MMESLTGHCFKFTSECSATSGRILKTDLIVDEVIRMLLADVLWASMHALYSRIGLSRRIPFSRVATHMSKVFCY